MRWCTMGAKSDQVKGQAKEVTAKDKVEEVIDKTKDAAHRK